MRRFSSFQLLLPGARCDNDGVADAVRQRAAKFLSYEVDGDELVKDLASFALANAIFHCLVEGHAAEISARRNAMDNASSK